MIPSYELIRRLDKQARRFRWEMTQFGQGMYQGIKLCIAIVKAFETETQKHFHNNPKAVGALIAQVKHDHWSNHKRWTLHRPKKQAA